MTNAHRDLATPELWTRSLERSRRRRELLPKARRENSRKKHISAALATAVVAGPGAPLAAAQVSGDMSAAVAAESPANRAIEIREGGLPLRVGSQGELVAHVQTSSTWRPTASSGRRPTRRCAGTSSPLASTWTASSGPSTWSSLFAKAGANGAAMGGSNIPPQVKQEVEQRLEQAGRRLAAQGNAGAGTAVGGQVGLDDTDGAHDPRANSTLPTTQAPAGRVMRLVDDLDTRERHGHVELRAALGTQPRRHRHRGPDRHARSARPPAARSAWPDSRAATETSSASRTPASSPPVTRTCRASGCRTAHSVQQGQVIGYVGCTGNCTGPHLHFETRVNGQAQDPRTVPVRRLDPGRAGDGGRREQHRTQTGSSTTSTGRRP